MKMNAEMKGINVNAGAAKVPDEMLEKVSGGFVAPRHGGKQEMLV